jgi:hypothetical protein
MYLNVAIRSSIHVGRWCLITVGSISVRGIYERRVNTDDMSEQCDLPIYLAVRSAPAQQRLQTFEHHIVFA